MFLRTAFVASIFVAYVYCHDDLADLLAMTSGMTNKPQSWGPSVSACNWEGVICTGGNVTMLAFSSLSLEGTVDLTRIPHRVTMVNLTQNRLSGNVDLSLLPKGLQILVLTMNQFSGPVDFSQLPAGLNTLAINANQFSGNADLSRIPVCQYPSPCLYNLNIEANNFTNLTGPLPYGLYSFEAGLNAFEGIDVPSLFVPPPCCCCWQLIIFHLQQTGIKGAIDLSRVPAGVSDIELDGNALTLVGGSAGLTMLPQSVRKLTLANNKIQGNIELDKLPRSLYGLTLGGNALCGTMLISLVGQAYWCKGFDGSNVCAGGVTANITCPGLGVQTPAVVCPPC